MRSALPSATKSKEESLSVEGVCLCVDAVDRLRSESIWNGLNEKQTVPVQDTIAPN